MPAGSPHHRTLRAQKIVFILSSEQEPGPPPGLLCFIRPKEYRNVIREYLWNHLLVRPCAECGEKDPVVLEFHHVREKDMAIAEMVTRISNMERLEDELGKILCSNCHHCLTAKERGWFRGRK